VKIRHALGRVAAIAAAATGLAALGLTGAASAGTGHSPTTGHDARGQGGRITGT